MKKTLLLLSLSLIFCLTACQKQDNSTVTTTTPAATQAEIAATTPVTQADAATPKVTANKVPAAAEVQQIDVLNVEAVNKAVSLFKDKYQHEDLRKVQLDEDHGQYFYKVEGLNNQQKSELKLKADTWDIVKEELKQTDDSDLTFHLSDALDVQAAYDKAMKGQEQHFQIVEWQLDFDNNVLVYEYKGLLNGKDYDIKVDAKTGQLIEIDD